MKKLWSDSMGVGIPQRLTNLLGETVYNGATGGDTILEVQTRFKSNGGAGHDNIFRAGHNVHLRQGKLDIIRNAMDEMVNASNKFLVQELGLNDDVAYGTTQLAADIRDWRLEINNGWAEKYGANYHPLQTEMIAEGRKLPNLTAEEIRDMDNGLLPRRWRAPLGNDGHMTNAARDVAAKLTKNKIDQVWSGLLTDPAPKPTQPTQPTPVAPKVPWWKRLFMPFRK